ncbi:MAG TPA: di-heme oxidoredictase family protein [Micropepsaceae bacterium]
MIRRNVLTLGIFCLAAGGLANAAADTDVTVENRGRAAFQQPMPFLDSAGVERFRAGASIFRQPWLVAPSDEQPRFDGLGPLSNRLSCAGCHIGNGRGETSAGENDVLRSSLVRLSVPGKAAMGAPAPEPVYGDQLQPIGIQGVPSEGDATIGWHETEQTLDDGTRISLRRPELIFKNLHYGPFAQGTMTSVRMAPAIFGLGLLEAVPEAELKGLADPSDANHDGVRGRLNRVWDVASGRIAIGRFGLKDNQPNLGQQVAAALIGDMGITSHLFREQNCTVAEKTCAGAAKGGDPEISDADFATLVFSIEALAPPAPKPAGAAAKDGQALFQNIGCAACHVPSLTTGDSPQFPQAAHKTIHPYTDLLLHDMGEDLSDGRPDFDASGRDWRTTPLWGFGLASTVVTHPAFLHDGRARDVTEAILWHGGEAQHARDRFASLSATDRKAIVEFLQTL